MCIMTSFVGCSNGVNSQVNSENKVSQSGLEIAKVLNTQELTKLLEQYGYNAKATKDDKQGIFSGALTIITIDGDIISAYEYKNNQQMEQEARTIGSDGSKIGNALYDFKSKPHFYKKGNIIVSYIGDNKETIKKIEQILGQQFAGLI